MSDAKTVYGVFCGSDAPQLITSTANDLFIEFVSNNETHDEGFLAVYAAIGLYVIELFRYR